MPLTLLLLIFIIIAFISVLTLIFITVKNEKFLKRPYSQSIIVCIFIFNKLGTICNNFLFVTPQENE